MRAILLFVLVTLGSMAANAGPAGPAQAQNATRTFWLRGDIASAGRHSQYFGAFEIAAEPPTRFVQSEMRAYFDSERGQIHRVTAMGFDGARTIYQPEVPEYPSVPILVKATKAQEQQIRASAEEALRRVLPFVSGARAPFTMTRGGEIWTVRDLKINVDLPDKLFRPR